MAEHSGSSVADQVDADPEERRYPLARQSSYPQTPISRTSPQVRRAPTGNLYDVLDLILDKGIVIDAFVRVSVVGIELITVDLRVVIASVDTYMRYAEAAERLNIHDRQDATNLKDMTQGGKSKAMKGVGRALTGGGGDDDGDEEEKGEEDENEGAGSRLAHGVRHVLKRGVGRIMEKLSGEDHGYGDDDEEEESGGGRGERGREQREPRPRREREGRNGGGRARAGSQR